MDVNLLAYKSTLPQVPVSISMARNIKVSTERLEDFLLTEEQQPRQTLDAGSKHQQQQQQQQQQQLLLLQLSQKNQELGGDVAVLQGAALGWASEDDRARAESQ